MVGNILALDLATRTGWCAVPLGAKPVPQPLMIAAGEPVIQPRSGVEDFSRLKEGDYYGRFYAGFRRWLDDMLTVHAPEYLVFEAAISMHRSQQAARVLLYLAGCVEEVWDTKGGKRRNCFEVNVQHVKIHATGRGNVKKEEMTRAARDRGLTFADDNECDALWLADYALTILQRRQGVR